MKNPLQSSIFLSKFFSYGLLFFYCGIIFYLSSQVFSVETPYSNLDKIVHLIEYSILGFLASNAFSKNGSKENKDKTLFLSILFSFFYGLSDEVHQLTVPGRTFSLMDLLFDLLGGSLGGWFFWKSQDSAKTKTF